MMEMMMFIVNSILLGAGLAMDAFSVSLANGMNETEMKKGRMVSVSGVFAGFQFLMPVIGWLCVHTIATLFTSFQKCIPWIALGLLLYIGGSMLKEGLGKPEEQNLCSEATISQLFLQGIATSIDALSVGFTISSYNLMDALLSSALIGITTWIICFIGLHLGKLFGMKFANKASILGGVILILIGLEIFVKGVFF